MIPPITNLVNTSMGETPGISDILPAGFGRFFLLFCFCFGLNLLLNEFFALLSSPLVN